MDDELEKTGSPGQDPTLKNVGVIGAGVMGSGIVHYFANKGCPVAVKDLKPEVVEKGIGMVKAEFETAVEKTRQERGK